MGEGVKNDSICMSSIMNGPLSELCSPIYSTPTNSWQAWDSNGKILTEHQMVNKSNCVNKLKMFISNFIGDPNKIHSNGRTMSRGGQVCIRYSNARYSSGGLNTAPVLKQPFKE